MKSTEGGRVVKVLAYRETISDQPPVDSLQREGFLPPSYVDKNSFGQKHALLIKQVTPPDGNAHLEAIVTTFDGQAIPDHQLGRVAGHVGASGGYVGGVDMSSVNSSDIGMIVGNFGGWRSAISDWSGGGVDIAPGSVQTTLTFENGNLLMDYLYRSEVPGVPDANTMNTNINMNSHKINRVAALTGVSKHHDKYGGTKPSVVTIEGDVDVIDVWSRSVSTDGISVKNNATVGGTIDVTGRASFRSDVDVRGGVSTNSVSLRDGNGNTTATLRAEGGNAVIKPNNKLVVDGKADIVELDVENVWLTMASRADLPSDSRFQQGRKIKLRDLLPRTVAHYSYQVTESSNLVYKPVCGSGGQPRIMLYRQVESYSAAQSQNLFVIENGIFASNAPSNPNHYWQVRWEGTQRSGGVERSAVAQTFCSYQ